jgi:hypothetical protein
MLRKKYRQLAVFAEDATIPSMALTRVWEFVKASETEACAGVFVQAGLLEKRVDGADGEYVSYRLHDLCRDYVRWRVEKEKGEGAVRAMQRSFVEWLAGEDWEETLTADGDDRSRRVRARAWERTFEAAVGMEVVSRSKAEPSVEGAKAVYEFSRLLKHFGRLVEAKETAKRSLEMRYAIHGDDEVHPEIATSVNGVSHLQRSLRRLLRLHQASKMLQQSTKLVHRLRTLDTWLRLRPRHDLHPNRRLERPLPRPRTHPSTPIVPVRGQRLFPILTR